MRRREFITLLGCVSVAWPLAASAQQTDQVRHIGLFLVIDADAPETKARLEGFRRGLKELGWSEGRNLRLEFRYALAIREDQAQVFAKELVALQPDTMLTHMTEADWDIAVEIFRAVRSKRGEPGHDDRKFLEALHYFTGHNITWRMLPVFGNWNSVWKRFWRLSRTGTFDAFFEALWQCDRRDLSACRTGRKTLELLRELVPAARRIGLLINPSNTTSEAQTRNVTAAASADGVRIDVLRASDSHQIEAAFATMVGNRADALLIGTDPYFYGRRVQIATLATRHAIPAIHPVRENVEAGAS